MRALIFAILALGMLVAGCGRNKPPAVDHLRSQLLRESCEALQDGDLERAAAAVQRLEEAFGEDSFTEFTTVWLEQRQTLEAVNRAFAEGDIQGADRILEQATGSSFRATASTQPAVDALAALEHYLERRPFHTASAAQNALDELREHSSILSLSRRFRDFLAIEENHLQALRTAEKQALIDLLLEELDVLAVTGNRPAQPLLAHLAAVQPDHPLLRSWKAALTGDSQALTGVLDTAGRSSKTRRSVEIALCIAWHDMAAAAWQVAAPTLTDKEPLSLSGTFMKAIADADAGNWQLAVEGLKAVAKTATPSDRHIARLMRTYLLPPRQFGAWCWQTPCPGIPELLSRISQIHTHGRMGSDGL